MCTHSMENSVALTQSLYQLGWQFRSLICLLLSCESEDPQRGEEGKEDVFQGI